MNDDRILEERVTSVYAETAPSREPARLLDDVLLTTSRARQRPRWLALIKEPPMRISTRVAVGSPMARLASIALATLLLAVMATGAVVAGVSLLAGPGVIVVAQDGSGTYATITEALAAAEDGDSVIVKPGTYVGTVVIDEDITLRGDGPREDIVLEFTADSPTILTEWAPVPYGVLLVDTAATISDLTVRGPNVAAAFVVVGGAPIIERVVNDLEGDFSGSPQTSVGLVHGAAATVRDSILDGPIWELGQPIVPGYEGVQGTSRVTVADNLIDSGIWVTVTDGGSVTGNTVTNGPVTIGTIEITLIDGGTAEVSGNTASAIVFGDSDSTGVTVRENTLRGGDEFGVGINLGPGSPVIEGNDIRDVRVGIVVPVGATPTISSNVIEGTEIGINVNDADTSPIIEGNRFCGNDQDLAVPDGSTLTLDASNEICPAEAAANE